MTKSLPLEGLLFAVYLLACGVPSARAQQSSGQEFKSEVSHAPPDPWKTLCGKPGMLTNVTEIPSMGCFRLSLGNQAQGDFAGHVLTINIGAQGEACRVDGAVFNCAGCIDGSRNGCPATLTAHSRDPDGSVNFFVARQVAGHIYVTTQENFDFEARLLESAKKASAEPAGAFNAGTPIPDGSYSSWPEDSKRKAVSALGFRCAMLSVMQLGNYQRSKEAAGELAKAMSMACMDHQMPADWPERASVQAIEKEHLDKARQLDPSISVSPDELWAQLAKKIKADDVHGIVANP